MLPALLIGLVLLSTTGAAAPYMQERAEALSQQVVDRFADALSSERGQAAQQRGHDLARQMIEGGRLDWPLNGISDPTMAAAWEAIRDKLGIGERDHFYIFVSFSMPESLLRAYALDAAAAGGVLVFRGIEDGSDLQSFFANRLSKLVRPGAFVAPVQIDPRLFDTYGIERVPTMVLAREPEEGLCLTPVEKVNHVHGQAVSYLACPTREEGAWKIAGSVTSLYALEQFAELGAVEAEPFIAALRAGGLTDGTEQVELTEERWRELVDEIIGRNTSLLPDLQRINNANE